MFFFFESGENDSKRKKQNKTPFTFLNPSDHCSPLSYHSRLPSHSSPPLPPHLDLTLIVLPVQPQRACTSDSLSRESCPNTCSFNVQFSFPCSESQPISLLHLVLQPFFLSAQWEQRHSEGKIALRIWRSREQRWVSPWRHWNVLHVICHRSCCGGHSAPLETIKAQWHCIGVNLKVRDC